MLMLPLFPVHQLLLLLLPPPPGPDEHSSSRCYQNTAWAEAAAAAAAAAVKLNQQQQQQQHNQAVHKPHMTPRLQCNCRQQCLPLSDIQVSEIFAPGFVHKSGTSRKAGLLMTHLQLLLMLLWQQRCV
jgi:hypothetical protein